MNDEVKELAEKLAKVGWPTNRGVITAGGEISQMRLEDLARVALEFCEERGWLNLNRPVDPEIADL